MIIWINVRFHSMNRLNMKFIAAFRWLSHNCLQSVTSCVSRWRHTHTRCVRWVSMCFSWAWNTIANLNRIDRSIQTGFYVVNVFIHGHWLSSSLLYYQSTFKSFYTDNTHTVASSLLLHLFLGQTRWNDLVCLCVPHWLSAFCNRFLQIKPYVVENIKRLELRHMLWNSGLHVFHNR